jgi:sodium-dependent dicarboxylate transporter 2/3/5
MSAASVRRTGLVATGLLLLTVAAWIGIPDPLLARVVILCGGALLLWLSEALPPWVPTLLLVAGIPLALGRVGPEYRLGSVMGWAADPVLALFFGGFALGAAASRHQIDAFVTDQVLALSCHRRRRLLVLVMAATAALSMWMSNIAAAAMMLAALRPHLDRSERTEPFRRALLLGVAMAANLGGIATPIGSGPNGIAVASLEAWARVTFIQWLVFAVPLMAGMLVLAYVLIARAHDVRGAFQPVELQKPALTGRARGLVVVFGLAVAAWLTEPVHGVPAPIVALLVAAVLFGGGWLGREDLGRIDWSTLLLIAGGMVMARLAEASGLVHTLSGRVDWHGMPLAVRVTGFVSIAALMGAVVSNTASAAMLIPLALGLDLPRSIAILIAIGTSFGVPFAISTPPNAMAYGEGGLTARDLLRVGLPLMLVGSLVIGLTGLTILHWLGLP